MRFDEIKVKLREFQIKIDTRIQRIEKVKEQMRVIEDQVKNSPNLSKAQVETYKKELEQSNKGIEEDNNALILLKDSVSSFTKEVLKEPLLKEVKKDSINTFSQNLEKRVTDVNIKTTQNVISEVHKVLLKKDGIEYTKINQLASYTLDSAKYLADQINFVTSPQPMRFLIKDSDQTFGDLINSFYGTLDKETQDLVFQELLSHNHQLLGKKHPEVLEYIKKYPNDKDEGKRQGISSLRPNSNIVVEPFVLPNLAAMGTYYDIDIGTIARANVRTYLPEGLSYQAVVHRKRNSKEIGGGVYEIMITLKNSSDRDRTFEINRGTFVKVKDQYGKQSGVIIKPCYQNSDIKVSTDSDIVTYRLKVPAKSEKEMCVAVFCRHKWFIGFQEKDSISIPKFILAPKVSTTQNKEHETGEERYDDTPGLLTFEVEGVDNINQALQNGLALQILEGKNGKFEAKPRNNGITSTPFNSEKGEIYDISYGGRPPIRLLFKVKKVEKKDTKKWYFEGVLAIPESIKDIDQAEELWLEIDRIKKSNGVNQPSNKD